MADVLTEDQRKTLSRFLLRQAKFPHRWGTHDCGLFLADWMVITKSVDDPAADVRGTYSDRASAEAMLESRGRLAGFVAHLAEACGLSPTEQPKDGDVGIIEMPKFGPTCGIMTRASWAFRSVNGLTWSKAVPGRIIAAWSVF